MFLLRWRCIFPGRWLTRIRPFIDSRAFRAFPSALFNLVFPDDCRVCQKPLVNLSRIPVCPDCLHAPKPFLAEHFCTDCGTPFLNAAPLDANGRCSLCRNGLTGFDAVYTYGEYDGALRSLIHVFKYGGVMPLTSRLGPLLSGALPREQQFDVIVAMPLHWRKKLQRGFNQSELLARFVSRRTGIPFANALRRRKGTAPQAGLTRAQRRTNVAGAFEVSRRDKVEGRHVLLIDDVFTTGATAGACSAVLKRAGAKRVSVLTLARADRRKSLARVL
jgi:ComF family protein